MYDECLAGHSVQRPVSLSAVLTTRGAIIARSFGPTGFGNARAFDDRSRPSFAGFFSFFFFTQRNETPAPRHPILLLPPPPPSPPLPVTRSRRNKTLARFCFPLLSSCTFFFLSFARYSSFSPRVLFLSTVVVVEARCSFLRFLLSFFLSLRRERSASKSFPLFFLEQFSSFASTLCRRSRTSEGSFERLGGQREDDCTPSGIATRHSHSGAVGEIGSPTDRIFAGSTVRAILESKKENTKPCCLGKNDGYLLDNDTTYRDRPVSPGFRFARRITVNLQSITLLSLLPLSKNLAQKKKEKKNLSIVIERTLLCNEIITIQYKLCMYVYGRRFFCSI